MKKAIFRNCLLTAVTLTLPGCLAINAALGVIGFLGTGPIQYAGTAYSIGEYSYEFAINDKTPDEVIAEKLAWLLPDEEKEENPIVTAHVESLKNPSMDVPLSPFQPEAQHAMAEVTPKPTMIAPPSVLPPMAPSGMEVAFVTPAKSPIPAIKRLSLPDNKKQQRTRTTSKAPTSLAQATPAHQYVERQTDPLLEKMNRLEQLLPQAEMIVAQRATEGVRYGVSTGEDGQDDLGISGSWSIRHRLN